MSPESKWFIYTKRADFEAVASRFGIDPVTARVLRNRDLTEDSEIAYLLNAGISDLYDEREIPDMDKAAELVLSAVDRGAHIRVVGDYDIDGVCATCILLKGLREIGARADHRIPERIRDGYGINEKIVREAIEDGVDLILTCDNGIAALEELALAREAGIMVVVTDHHNVRRDEAGNDILPPADAVVDVKRRDSAYPTEEICGAVTAWKLIRCLFRGKGLPERTWLKYLDLAAIATVGDVMQLTGENHIIVREGLKILGGGPQFYDDSVRGTANVGLRALLHSLELEEKPITTYHIGFMVGPCINAGGRLETAETALSLFMTDDAAEAERMAAHLQMLNEERKGLTETGVRKALEIVEKDMREDRVLVVCLPELHESLAGIVAGRVKEATGRPTFILTRAQEGLKGSGRSIEAYNMFEELCGTEELLTRFGGHPMAAGISLKEEDLEAFRRKLNSRSKLKEEDLTRKLWIDSVLPLSYISERLILELERLAPFGPGFERPLFARKDLKVHDLRVLGKNRNVLKLLVSESGGAVLEGILFGEADRMREELREAVSVDLVFQPSINEYRGRKSIQLEIRDFRCQVGNDAVRQSKEK